MIVACEYTLITSSIICDFHFLFFFYLVLRLDLHHLRLPTHMACTRTHAYGLWLGYSCEGIVHRKIKWFSSKKETERRRGSGYAIIISLYDHSDTRKTVLIGPYVWFEKLKFHLSRWTIIPIHFIVLYSSTFPSDPLFILFIVFFQYFFCSLYCLVLTYVNETKRNICIWFL